MKLIERSHSNHVIQKFKCGEIFCINAKSYNITCEFCNEQIAFDDFLKHFSETHIPQDGYKPPLILEEMVESNLLDNDEIYDGQSESEVGINGEDIFEEKPIALNDLEKTQRDTFVETFNKKPKEEEFKSLEIKRVEQSPTNKYADTDDDVLENFDSDSGDDFVPKPSLKIKNKTLVQLPVTCPICNNIYKNKDSLRRHKFMQHKQEAKATYKCDECQHECRTESSLRNHKYIHTGIVCDICGKTYKAVGDLNLHKKLHDAPKAFKCKECPYSSKTKKGLQSHMNCHYPEPVVCELCGLTLRNRFRMPAHMKRHNNDRPAQCEVCDKRFFSNFDLKIHFATHTNERPFQCDVCGSRFRIKKSLRVHKKVHMKDLPKPFVCRECNKAFLIEKGLVAHMRTHDPDYRTLFKLKDDNV